MHRTQLATATATAIALCHAQPDGLHCMIALNFELPSDGKIPEWLDLIPQGPHVRGRDGREWLNDVPDQVVAGLQREAEQGRYLVLDWEHATELKAPQGEKAPAAGWFREFRLQDGVIQGKLSLNAAGRKAIEDKEWLYYSPALLYEKESRRIRGLSSVGLTNKANLSLTALNHQQTQEEDTMLEELLKILGLDKSTDQKTALNAVQQKVDELNTVTGERDKLKSDLQTALNNAQTPSLEKFVPRTDYDAVLERATNAEQKLHEIEKAGRDKEIETAVNAAVREGKIAPASKDFYMETCRQEGGLEKFREFVKSAPVVCDPTDLDERQLEDQATALNAEQQKVADMFGNSAEDLTKYAGA